MLNILKKVTNDLVELFKPDFVNAKKMFPNLRSEYSIMPITKDPPLVDATLTVLDGKLKEIRARIKVTTEKVEIENQEVNMYSILVSKAKPNTAKHRKFVKILAKHQTLKEKYELRLSRQVLKRKKLIKERRAFRRAQVMLSPFITVTPLPLQPEKDPSLMWKIVAAAGDGLQMAWRNSVEKTLKFIQFLRRGPAVQVIPPKKIVRQAKETNPIVIIEENGQSYTDEPQPSMIQRIKSWKRARREKHAQEQAHINNLVESYKQDIKKSGLIMKS